MKRNELGYGEIIKNKENKGKHILDVQIRRGLAMGMVGILMISQLLLPLSMTVFAETVSANQAGIEINSNNTDSTGTSTGSTDTGNGTGTDGTDAGGAPPSGRRPRC